jgi:hypothetical protein
METGRNVKCGSCGQPLNERTDLPVEERRPCPSCGSVARAFAIELNADMGVHAQLGLKAHRQGKGRPFQEQIAGEDLHRGTGRWYQKRRVIDRENDRYVEHISDPATGEIIRDVDERLTEHRDHGSAKDR